MNKASGIAVHTPSAELRALYHQRFKLHCHPAPPFVGVPCHCLSVGAFPVMFGV